MAAIVESRCAIAITVLPDIRFNSCSWIAASASESRALAVEDQDRGVLQQHPSNGNPLALPARELDATLPNARFVAPAPLRVFETNDELVCMRAFRRLDCSLGSRFRPAVDNIVKDGAVEERCVLRHHADRSAQALLGHTHNVLVVDQNAALLKIVEAKEQADERRFSGSRPADEADFLARPYRQGKSIDDARRVGAGRPFCAA